MAQDSKIAWCDHTFNAAWGCEKISPGCTNCYADALSDRYGFDVWGPGKARRTFGEKHWKEPLAWNRAAERAGLRARVFCSSMTDVFLDDPTIEAERGKLWPLIRATPSLNWLLLTKRSDRIAACLPADWGPHGYSNVWLGVSVEGAEYAYRADQLRAVPAAVRFVSYEPALGPLAHALDLSGIDWLIVGGESGPRHRPMEHQWARDVKAACEAAGVAFFFKQSSAYRPDSGIELDGAVLRAYPSVRRVALPVLGD
jgi:protein gp37